MHNNNKIKPIYPFAKACYKDIFIVDSNLKYYFEINLAENIENNSTINSELLKINLENIDELLFCMDDYKLYSTNVGVCLIINPYDYIEMAGISLRILVDGFLI